MRIPPVFLVYHAQGKKQRGGLYLIQQNPDFEAGVNCFYSVIVTSWYGAIS